MTLFQHLKKEAWTYAQSKNVVLEECGVTKTCVYVIVKTEAKKSIGTTLTPHAEGLNAIKSESIKEIFDYSDAYNPLQRAVALALINALGQHALGDDIEVSKAGTRSLLPQKILEMTQAGDEIVFIGNLEPVVAKLKQEGRNPIVFCRQKKAYEEAIYSDIFEYEAISKSKIAIITGAALIGSTIDALLAMSPKNAIRIMAGFSAAAHPLWLRGRGLTHVASMKLTCDLKASLMADKWEEMFCYPSYFQSLGD